MMMRKFEDFGDIVSGMIMKIPGGIMICIAQSKSPDKPLPAFDSNESYDVTVVRRQAFHVECYLEDGTPIIMDLDDMRPLHMIPCVYPEGWKKNGKEEPEVRAD